MSWIDRWLEPGLWQFGLWSLRWALLIALPMAWFAIRPPRTAAVRMLVAQLVLLAGLLSPFVPRFWGPAFAAEVNAPSKRSSASAKGTTTEPDSSLQKQTMPSSNDAVTASDRAAPATPGRRSLNNRLGGSTHELAPLSTREPLGWRRWTALVLTAVLLIGQLGGAIRLIAGWLWLRRLVRQAEPVIDGQFRAEFDRCRELLDVKRNVQLGVHPAVHSPLLVGGKRPWILVPAQWTELSATARRAILMHELAHVRRRDDFARLLEELVRVCFFFHPMVHWLLARLGADREELCDAAVLNQGVAPRELAGVLLECCRVCGIGRPALELRIAALPFFRPPTAMDRVRTLMEEPSMSRWKLCPSRRCTALLSVVTIAVATLVGGFGIQAAEEPTPTKKPAVTDNEQPLPTVAQIQAAYRANITRLMPLGVSYRVRAVEQPVSVEGSRRRLKELEMFQKESELPIELYTVDGTQLDAAQVQMIKVRMAEELQGAKRSLQPDSVRWRLTERVEDRCYFWTDGRSFHSRRPNEPDAETTFFPGPLTPPENLTTLYRSMSVSSWSKANDPPFRHFGGDQGVVAAKIHDYSTSRPFPPVGFVNLDWAQDLDGNVLDRFMSHDSAHYQVVGRADYKGRATILMDGFFTPPGKEGWQKGTRAWIDPNQGYLPLRLEWTWVDSKGKLEPGIYPEIEVLEVKSIAGGFYPAQIKEQRFVYDHVANELQQAEIAAGRLPKDTPAPPYQPGRITTWELIEIVPHQPIEPGALALEFPKGAMYRNFVDNKTYYAGNPNPEPPPQEAIQEGQAAPPWQVNQWTDGKTHSLDDFRGKVVFLVFHQFPDNKKEEWKSNYLQSCPMMKKLQTQYADRGVVFLEIFSPGTDIATVRELHKASHWDCLAAIDTSAPKYGATSWKYTASGNGYGPVILGRDGVVVFNGDALGYLDEHELNEFLYQAAKAASLPWPLDEEAPKEESDRQNLRLMESLFSLQIDAALAKP